MSSKAWQKKQAVFAQTVWNYLGVFEPHNPQVKVKHPNVRNLKAYLRFLRKGVYGPITSLPTLHASAARAWRTPPEEFNLRRGDAAARAVIGPLTKTRTRRKRLRGHCRCVDVGP